MTEYDSLYTSWRVRGSYFNRIIHCGSRYNRWVEIALGYLPREIFFEYREKLAFISTAESDACRLARTLCENREIILLSERILPKSGVSEDHSDVRYFIFTILHEVAHAVKKHRSPLFDNLTVEENQAQEKEADDIALSWFNYHVKRRNNPYLKPIKPSEIKIAKERNQNLMKKMHENSNLALSADS